jgi:hypothetical protein
MIARVPLPAVAALVSAPLACLLWSTSPLASALVVVAGASWPRALPSATPPWAVALSLALALYAGPLLRTPGEAATWGFLGGVVASVLLQSGPVRAGRGLAAAGALLLALAIARTGVEAVLARGFSPSEGLMYWNPVLWLAVLGGVSRFDARAGLALLALGGAVSVPADSPLAPAPEGLLLAAAGALLAQALEMTRRSALARPMAWIAAGGAVLTLWNFLFMEQYRRFWIPRDDTVSFVDVARNNARLVSAGVGAPLAWPASWLFAARHDVSPDRYELLLSLPLPSAQDDVVVELASPAAEPLLADGWSDPRDCGAVRCREIQGAARILLRRAGPLTTDLVLRASGRGSLEIQVNGIRAAVVPLVPDAAEIRVRLAPAPWRAGVNELRFLVSDGAPAAVERIVLHPVGGGA